MRWYGQVAVVAVIGALGYGGWHAYSSGAMATWPVVGGLVASTPRAPAADARRAMPPPVVEVANVATGKVVDTREAVGTLRAAESVILTAKVAGTVEAILFEEGARVGEGQELVKFDRAERRADIEQSAAEVLRATAQRDEVRQRLDRAQLLRRSGSATEAQVDDLTAQFRSAEAAIAAAEARRRAAEARLEDLILRAPFAGRIGARQISVGALVAPGTRIATLDDLSRVRLDFSVPENLLASLKPGQAVRAQSAAFPERSFEGTVTLVDSRIDPVSRSVRLTADFPNADETLRPGMFLSVSLTVSERPDAILVPEEAVVGEGLRHIVFVVKGDEVERRVVSLGQRLRGEVEVLDGLAAGEMIVVRGVQRVRPGQKVIARPVGAAPAASPEAKPEARRTGAEPEPAPGRRS